MSDINCPVCGEPWDQYGIGHGDMLPWEAKLFRQGAGCPCCEGIAPPGQDHLEDHLRSVVMESEDPDSFVLLHNPTGTRPAWKRPEDEIVFSCAGCDSQLKKSVDDGELYWHTPAVDRYYYNRPGGDDWSTDVADLFKIGDKLYCHACATSCDDCGEVVFRSGTSCTGAYLVRDTYDPGASHPDPRNYHHTICTGCLEAIPTCGYCGSVLDEDDPIDDEGRGSCCAKAEPDGNEDEEEDPGVEEDEDDADLVEE